MVCSHFRVSDRRGDQLHHGRRSGAGPRLPRLHQERAGRLQRDRWGGVASDVRPFVEIRGTLTALQIGLSNGDYGAPFNAYLPGLATRGGVLVPLSEYFFLDAGVGVGLLGPERFTLDVGLGLPIPLANL